LVKENNVAQIPSYQTPQPSQSQGMSVASLVLGIIALVLFCVWYISIPCAVIAIVLGSMAGGKARRGEGGGAGLARAGVICAIVAVALDILIIILAIVGISLLGSKMPQLQQQIQQQIQQQQKMQQQQQQQSPTTAPSTTTP
jgi:phosphate/sulfate permease